VPGVLRVPSTVRAVRAVRAATSPASTASAATASRRALATIEVVASVVVPGARRVGLSGVVIVISGGGRGLRRRLGSDRQLASGARDVAVGGLLARVDVRRLHLVERVVLVAVALVALHPRADGARSTDEGA